MQTSKLEAKLRLIKSLDLFRFLEMHEVPYVLVGDLQNYHEGIKGDTDIIIAPSAAQAIPKILYEFCSGHQAKLIQMLQHEKTSWFFICQFSNKKGNLSFLYADVCTHYFRNGTLFLRAEEMLDARYRINENTGGNLNFFVPAPEKAFIYYLLKKVDKEKMDVQQSNYLSTQWKKDPAGALQQCQRFWPEHYCNLISRAATANEWSKVQSEFTNFKTILRERLPFSFRHFSQELLRKVHRILQPTGLQIIFLGVDGSGKTTVLNEIEKKVGPAFRNTKIYHLRTHFGQRFPNVSIVRNPHAKPSRGKFLSFFKLCLWWIDYRIMHMIEVYPLLVRSTLVLFDRYYYDLLVDPVRYRYGGRPWLARLVSKSIPHPDLVILLDGPPEVLQKRKAEVSLKETTRQSIAYRTLIQEMDNGYIVDSSEPLEKVISKVESIVLDYLTKRTINRLRITN